MTFRDRRLRKSRNSAAAQRDEFRLMLTLLQISDLHVGPPFLPRVAEALVRQVPALNADVIVANGDFTQRATEEQFIQARALLDQLPKVPTVHVPGNHDVPLYRVAERLLDPLSLYQKHICSDLNSVLRVDGAVIVALDSTAPYSGITNGRITRQQLGFCQDAFQDSPKEAARIVVAHHHFAPAPDYERTFPMAQAKRAMNCFLELGVDLILGGHLHRAYIGNSLDVYPGGARRRGVIIAQCGTTTSRRGRARERERNSFNLIHIWENMLRVTHYMYFDDRDEFLPLSRHVFPRSGNALVEDELKRNA